MFIPQRPACGGTPNAATGKYSVTRVNIDRVRQAHYIGRMTKKTDQPNIEQELELLEDRVGSLLDIVERLMKENRSLRTQQESLTTERAGLLEKHDQVRSRVDAIVTRLKSLETGA